jgi:hypothetical protein
MAAMGGCGPTTGTEASAAVGGVRALCDITVLAADKPVSTLLEPDPYGDDSLRSYEGDGSLRGIMRYDENLLKKLAAAGQGVYPVLEQYLEGPIDDPMRLDVSAKAAGLDRVRIEFWVATEACCGLRMNGATVRVASARGQREAAFSLEWPWGQQVLVELPPTHEGGRWTWILFALRREGTWPED